METPESDTSDIIIPVLPYDSDSEDDDVSAEALRKQREAERANERNRLYEENMATLMGQPPAHHAHSDRQLYKTPELYTDFLEEPKSCNIDYVDTRSAEWDPEDFKKRFIAQCRPAMLLGLTHTWRASTRWASPEAFAQYYGDMPLKRPAIVHKYGSSMSLMQKLQTNHQHIFLTRPYDPLKYMEYTKQSTADFPYYIFEREMDEERSPLTEDYQVPDVFGDDLYDSTPATRNFLPKERYMVIGPQRTGSNMHTDPKFTCAWNALLTGTKRWVLFPPNQDPDFTRDIGVPSNEMGGRVDPPTYWWTDVYPKLVSTGLGERLGMVDCLQRAGETIFVPQGWWHAVLNLDFTIAVTQNAVLPEMLADVWPGLAQRFPVFAGYFARTIYRRRPMLASTVPDLERVAMETAHEGERDDDFYGDYN